MAVLYWISTFLFMPMVTTIILFALLFTYYRWITILYVTWCIYDWNTPYVGGRNFNFVRNWSVWRHFANFFPMKLIKTVDLDPSKTYLFGNHPHGVLCAGAFCCFGTEAVGFSKLFPGLTPRLLTLRGQFMFPGYREVFMSTGACAATKQGMEALLTQKSGVAAILVPGGALEALNSDSDRIRLVLNRRKGFVKLALRYGVDLVPTFSFGENFIYDQVKAYDGSRMKRFQTWAEKWVGFTPVMFFGRGIFQYNYGILPHRKPVTVVVGTPIPVSKVEQPSGEQIEALHKQYIEALQQLYEDNKSKYGNENFPLVIE